MGRDSYLFRAVVISAIGACECRDRCFLRRRSVKSEEDSEMILRWSRRSALTTIAAAVALLAARPALLRAQIGESSMAQSAVGALTGEQQTAANSALCSAIGNQVPNPAAATPSLLSSQSVISAAAAIFASSVHLPLRDQPVTGLRIAPCQRYSGFVRYQQCDWWADFQDSGSQQLALDS